MTTKGPRTADCSRSDARARLKRAREFLAVAELVLGEREASSIDDDDLNLSGVAAALAVLAGIASADAATCFRLGLRSRDQDHRRAAELVTGVAPDGDQMQRDLNRLLNLKDGAHYGVLGIADSDAAKAVEWAKRMVTTAQRVMSE